MVRFGGDRRGRFNVLLGFWLKPTTVKPVETGWGSRDDPYHAVNDVARCRLCRGDQYVKSDASERQF